MLNTVHSCEILTSNFENVIFRFDAHLNNILSVVYDGKLDFKFLDHATLLAITQEKIFDNTIYRIAPSLLYELAKVDFVSYTHSKMNFLVSFPVISLNSEYNLIHILEIPEIVMYSQNLNMEYPSFLLPNNISIENVSSNVDLIRSTENCIKTEFFHACSLNIIVDDPCLISVISNEKHSCINEHYRDTKSYKYSSQNKGILVQLSDGMEIRKNNDILFDVQQHNEKICIFLPKSSDLKLISDTFEMDLFPFTKLTMSLNGIKARTPMIKSLLRMPKINNTKIYRPMSDEANKATVDYLYICSISISIILAFMMILIICCFMIFTLNTKKGDHIFPENPNDSRGDSL